MNIDDVEKQAQWELSIERFEEAVAKRKQQLRQHRPWWSRVFPWTISITVNRRK